MQAEPGAPHREVMQRFGFILEGWQKIMDLVHEDQPGFIMLRTFGRQAIAALLGNGFLGHVLGDLHAFDLHADIVHEDRVGAKFAGEVFLHIADALTHDHAKPFAARHLMQQLKSRRAVAEVQFQTTGVLLVIKIPSS